MTVFDFTSRSLEDTDELGARIAKVLEPGDVVLGDDDEFLELGAEEYFDRSGVTLIEWGDRVEHLLPPRASVVTMEFDEGGDRLVRIVGTLAQRLGASAAIE